ncbi:MAG: fluoride efflux transporter CrcB [Flavobacteriaceae bacterium]|nr:MAG: fluoride efflux transporter CrcB [Flavobacteriaceae bacterium]
MKQLLVVFLGGGMGSALRYFVSSAFVKNTFLSAPMGTFYANILGCFCLGIILNLFDKGQISENLRLLLAVGFCGGLTTFSTLIFEIGSIFQAESLLKASLALLLHLVFGLLAMYLGGKLAEVV